MSVRVTGFEKPPDYRPRRADLAMLNEGKGRASRHSVRRMECYDPAPGSSPISLARITAALRSRTPSLA